MKPLYQSYRDSFHKNIYRADADERVIGAPVVSTFAEADFLATVNEQKPQNVFFRLDSALNVLDKDGKTVAPLYDCLGASDCFVPVFCVKDKKTIEALADFTYDNLIADATICVPYERRELLDKVLTVTPMLRRMIDARSFTADALLNDRDVFELAGNVWQANSLMLLLPADVCQRRTVSVLQHRFVQVWADCGNASIAPATLAGVNGVICNDLSTAYDLLDKLPEGTVTRRVQIYAHKGFQNEGENPENTVTAVKLAKQHGIDGAEIDIKLSRDGVPILMHDFSTNKMLLTAPGQIFEELTWDEIRVMERERHRGEYIDRLEDVMASVKGDEPFAVMIEFKPKEGYYHIERMSQLVRDMLVESGMEHQAVITMGETPPNLNYVQTVLPRLPKVLGLWENIKDPKDMTTIEAMLFRFNYRLQGKTAVPSLEDVMVNRAYGERAKVHGLPPFVWMRGDYYNPSQWDDACHRSDDALVSGFCGSCADHAARYFHLPVELVLDETGAPVGLYRSGERKSADAAELIELGDGYFAYAIRLTLPMGKTFVLCTEAFRRQ